MKIRLVQGLVCGLCQFGNVLEQVYSFDSLNTELVLPGRSFGQGRGITAQISAHSCIFSSSKVSTGVNKHEKRQKKVVNCVNNTFSD